MNYEAERAMNQKRLRMEGEPGHGVVQGNGLPLNYMDNGHQISYQPYAGAYNTHYPPPEAFSPYGPPPPGGYAPQNLSYAPPAHQNYPHHQSFPPQQPPQPQLHMPQSHMVQSYSADIGVHKTPAWPPQPHLLTPLDAQKPLDIKHMKPEIKLEPSDSHKRPHADNEVMSELDQPKIKIKTDIFKPDELAHRPHTEKTHDVLQKPIDSSQKIGEPQSKDEGQANVASEVKTGDKPAEPGKPEAALDAAGAATGAEAGAVAGAVAGAGGEAPLAQETLPAKSEDDRKPFSSPEQQKSVTPGKIVSPGTEPKKRGRPKGSTNKPKSPGAAGAALAGGAPRALPPAGPGAAGLGAPRGPPGAGAAGAAGAPSPRAAPATGRPRGAAYQYAVRPFRKDFSGIQFRRRWSDDCLDSSHIPNEVYFGDVPVPPEVLHNYYDAHAERERLAAQAAHIAAQKAAQAKLAAARAHHHQQHQQHQQHQLQRAHEVTTVDSSSDDSSGSSGSDSDDSDDEQPLKRGPGRPKGSKNSSPRSSASVGSAGSGGGGGGGGGGRRGRPPVPPELRQPGVTDMKRFCKAAGVRFDYKKLVDGCTKNKERVAKMLELLVNAGLEGKPTLEKCRALKEAKQAKRDADKLAKRDAAHNKKHKEAQGEAGGEGGGGAGGEGRRMTRGATGVKPRQRIVISSDEEDGTPAARRTLSKLRSSLNDHSDTD